MKTIHLIFFLFLVVVIFCSCAITHETKTKGKTTIVTTDTTVIYHSGNGRTTVRTPVR